MIDRPEPAVPLWSRVLDDLRARLADGEFADRFPTDRELVEHYGISRHTAREAVRHLTEDGLVLRRRGRGSFLNDEVFEQPLGSLYSLFRSIEAQGVEQTSRVLGLVTVTDAEVATQLGLPTDTSLIRLERLRCAGGEPLAIDLVMLPATIAEPLLDCDFTHTALYDELAQRCGVVIDAARERIEPIVPEAAVAGLLGIPAGTAAFSIERLGMSRGTPLEVRRSVVRGDRFAFVADWSPDNRHGPLVAEHRTHHSNPARRRANNQTPITFTTPKERHR